MGKGGKPITSEYGWRVTESLSIISSIPRIYFSLESLPHLTNNVKNVQIFIFLSVDWRKEKPVLSYLMPSFSLFNRCP